MTREQKKKWMRILLLSAAIVLVASLSVLIEVKSEELFHTFQAVQPDLRWDDYVSYVMVRYLTLILEPVLLSIFYYVTRSRYLDHFLARVLLGGTVLIRWVLLLFRWEWASLFYYVLLVLYLLLFAVIAQPSQNRN